VHEIQGVGSQGVFTCFDTAQRRFAKGASAAATKFASLPRSIPMLDVIVLAIGLGFFALSIGYTVACDRL
jgi:hypothetical protein